MLCATMRRAPAARAALHERPRDLAAKPARQRRNPASWRAGWPILGRLVSSLTTTSGPNDLHRTDQGIGVEGVADRRDDSGHTEGGHLLCATREHRDLVTGRGQRSDQGPPDGPRPACDEHPHAPRLLGDRGARTKAGGWRIPSGLGLWQDVGVSEHSGYPGAPPGWYPDPAGGPRPALVGRLRVDRDRGGAPSPSAAPAVGGATAAGTAARSPAVGRGVPAAARLQHLGASWRGSWRWPPRRVSRWACRPSPGSWCCWSCGCSPPRCSSSDRTSRSSTTPRNEANRTPTFTNGTFSPWFFVLVLIAIAGRSWRSSGSAGRRRRPAPSASRATTRPPGAWARGSYRSSTTGSPTMALRDCLPPGHPHRPLVLQWWLAFAVGGTLGFGAFVAGLLLIGVCGRPVDPGRRALRRRAWRWRPEWSLPSRLRTARRSTGCPVARAAPAHLAQADSRLGVTEITRGLPIS